MTFGLELLGLSFEPYSLPESCRLQANWANLANVAKLLVLGKIVAILRCNLLCSFALQFWIAILRYDFYVASDYPGHHLPGVSDFWSSLFYKYRKPHRLKVNLASVSLLKTIKHIQDTV